MIVTQSIMRLTRHVPKRLARESQPNEFEGVLLHFLPNCVILYYPISFELFRF